MAIRREPITCCECGLGAWRPEYRFEPPLCNKCLFLPGWFKEPSEREKFAPYHDGRELVPTTMHPFFQRTP